MMNGADQEQDKRQERVAGEDLRPFSCINFGCLAALLVKNVFLNLVCIVSNFGCSFLVRLVLERT
jgi:hypothetical protein